MLEPPGPRLLQRPDPRRPGEARVACDSEHGVLHVFGAGRDHDPGVPKDYSLAAFGVDRVAHPEFMPVEYGLPSGWGEHLSFREPGGL